MNIINPFNLSRLKSGDAGTIKVQGVDFTQLQSVFVGVPRQGTSLVIDKVAILSQRVTGVTAGATLNIQKASKTVAPKATLTTALTGSNNDITLTAVAAGTPGATVSLTIVNPGANTATTTVAVVGSAITVTCAYAAAAITSTASQVLAAINASSAAAALVVASLATGNDGTGLVTALALTHLTGGVSNATLTTAFGVDNTDLVFTAVPTGKSGENISVSLFTPATPSSALAINVTGNTISIAQSTTAGTKQVASSTVVAAGGATFAGTLIVTVTGAALLNGALDVQVPIGTALTTATLIAAQIASYLNQAAAAGYASPAEFYTFASVGAVVSATALTSAANDATLKITWPAAFGISLVTASVATTGGVAPAASSTSASIITAIGASVAASALVTVADAGGSNGTGVPTNAAPKNLVCPWTIFGTLVASLTLVNQDFIDNVQVPTLLAPYEEVDSGLSGYLVNITGSSTATQDVKDVLIAFRVE